MPAPVFHSVAPADLSVPDFYQYLIGAVAPRPIAFVSSVSAAGAVNLSPFSFFTVVSMNPPLLVFSPTTRARDNSPKDTLRNVREVPEVVVNLCDYPLVEQLSLASAEYPTGTNEFGKAGLTEAPSQHVRPPRVAECPAAFECAVEQVIELGDAPGHGNLVICRVLRGHFRADVLRPDGRPGLDPLRYEAVSRLGGDWYSRLRPENLFEVTRPNRRLGIGFDALPTHIRESPVLTGNHLAKLANVEPEALPTPTDIEAIKAEPMAAYVLNKHQGEERRQQLAELARTWLDDNRVAEAWQLLMVAG